MGKALSKKQVLILSGAILAVTGCATYAVVRYRSFRARLDRAINAIGKIDPQLETSIPADKLMKILITVFKFSYEYKKEERDARRRERIRLLADQNYEQYAKEVTEAYKLEDSCEQEIVSTVLSRLGVTREMYEASKDRERAELQRMQLSVAALDALEIHVALTKEEARELHETMMFFSQITVVEDYIPRSCEAEALVTLGERWRELLKTMIVLDRLYGKYGLNGREVAASLRKYGIGLT